MSKWPMVPLREVCTLNYGKGLSAEDRPDSGDVPVYGANGIKGSTDKWLFDGPSIVVGRKGTAGALTKVDGKSWPLDVSYYVTLDGLKIDRDYLYYAIGQLDLPSLARGVKPGINREDVYDLSIPLPPLDEQKRIVAKLDEMTRALSKFDAANSARVTFLGDLRQAAIQDMVADSAPLHPLGDLVQILDSKRVPITKADRKTGEIPYYGATGIQDFVEGYIFDEPLVLLGEDGAKWSAGDRSAFMISGKTWVNNHAHVLRPHRSLILDEWMTYFLCMADLMPFVTGTTVPKLNQARMREIPIPVPSLERQRDLVEKLDVLNEEAHRLGEVWNQTSQEVLILKAALMDEALGGAA